MPAHLEGRTITLHPGPPEAIEADLVVVGNRRHKLSSVADHAIANLGCAVLLVSGNERNLPPPA